MLEIKNLKVIFNENTVNEKIALDSINLTINDGDFITVIGSNGAGKSGGDSAGAGRTGALSGRKIHCGAGRTPAPDNKGKNTDENIGLCDRQK